MVDNFRARVISRGTRKLTRTPMLIKKNTNRRKKKIKISRDLFTFNLPIFNVTRRAHLEKNHEALEDQSNLQIIGPLAVGLSTLHPLK